MSASAYQAFRVTRDARINERKGKVMSGGKLETVGTPSKDGGVESITVRYTGHGNKGEAKTGTEFRIKMPSLLRIAQRIE